MKRLSKILLTFLLCLSFLFVPNVIALDKNEELGKDNETALTEKKLSPGEVSGTKSASVVTGDNEDGRSVDITISINGKEFTTITQEEKEIVLVLDDSGSMDYSTSSTDETSRLKNLKVAAEELIDSLFVPENNNKIKVGIIYYGTTVKGSCSLTTNKSNLMVCLNAMNASGGTNIQAGIREAKNLFTNSTTSSKTIILLSDGEPTYYEDDLEEGQIKRELHGAGDSDNFENTWFYDDSTKIYSNNNKTMKLTRTYYEDNLKTNIVKVCNLVSNKKGEKWSDWETENCTTTNSYKPSDKAIDEVNEFKEENNNPNGTVYTVGFAISSGSSEETLLKSIASSDNKFFLASSLNALKSSFKAIINNVSLIATDVKVVDNVPNTFEIDKNYLETKFGTAIVQNNNSIKYGSNLVLKEIKDEITDKIIKTELSWYVGDLKSTDENILKYRLNALEDYYGNMYTNDGAVIDGKEATGNTFYGTTNPLKIELKNPDVAIPTVTKDDKYQVSQGNTLNIKTNEGVRKNDYLSKKTDNNATVEDQVVLEKDVTKGTLNLNKDGSFNYVAPTDYYGNVTFSYFIKSIITIGEENINKTVQSNTSTVTIDVEQIPTTYVIHHYLNDTTIKVAPDEVGTSFVYKQITGNAKTNLQDYILKGEQNQKTIVLKKDNNIIIFYYELKNGGEVTVHHYLKDTTKSISPDEKLNGLVTKIWTANSKELPNYNLVGEEKVKTGTYALEKNEVTFYYELKKGNVKVYYYEEKTTKELSKGKDLTGFVTTKYITEPETIPNWELVETPTNSMGDFTLEEQTVIYYYKKVMGKVTVNYLNKDGKELSSTIIMEDQQGNNYKTEAKKFNFYNLIKIDGKETGQYDSSEIKVTYIYEYVGGSDIPDTGIKNTNNYFAEIVLGIGVILLVGAIILRKKFN